MNPVAVGVFLVIVVPVLGFVAWAFLQNAFVRIDSGRLGLVIVRGRATDRTFEPGFHFVMPMRRTSIVEYPSVEMGYLTADTEFTPSEVDQTDPALPLSLGDRTEAVIDYTVRYRLRPERLRDIHERVGVTGVKGAVRDRTRQVLIGVLGADAVGFADFFGSARAELERSLTKAVTTALDEDGFEVAMFTLRQVDLGGVGQVLQATARARLEPELYALLGDTIGDDAIRHRQVEVWREMVRRWNGNSMGLPAVSPPRGTAATTVPVASTTPGATATPGATT